MGFFSAPGPLELIVILAVALIFLGPTRLPDAARSVGRGMREFRESLSGMGEPEEDPYDELEDDYEDEAVDPGADDPEQDEDEDEPEPAAETGADRA